MHVVQRGNCSNLGDSSARHNWWWLKIANRGAGWLLWGLLVGLRPAGAQPPTASQGATAAPAPTTARDSPEAKTTALSRIDAGLAVVDDPHGYWNRTLLLARPRIASGDVQALSAAIRELVPKFVLTIMAAVEAVEHAGDDQPRYRLADIGLAYSTEVAGVLTTVSVADAARLGIELGWFERMMLAENERQLQTARLVARTSTLTIFDVPALLARDAEHRWYVMRHFVWIDTSSGRAAVLVWLLRRAAGGLYVVERQQPARWFPAGLREDRAIHVDGRQFSLLGLPKPEAFAMEELPPGKDVAWTAPAAAQAAEKRYDADALRGLSEALNHMLRQPASP